MPYASNIQLVNDANGTAYAFLADNGAIWQCQWDAQAGGWVKGQVVPQAFGGEKLQALYLEELWPTLVSDISGANPGIVLAYRLGEGSSAEIWASFGTWANDGTVQWMAPQQLTKDQVDDQTFSLVEGTAGGFALVVQKKEAGAGGTTTLDKQNAASTAELQAKLEADISGARPDSDLYVNQYQLQVVTTNSSTSVVLKDITANQTSAAIQSAVVQTPKAAAPLALPGNTQLSRQDLIQPVTTATSTRALGRSVGAGSSTGTSWNAAQFNVGGGSLRVGLTDQNIMRWELNLPANKYLKYGNPKGDRPQVPDWVRDNETEYSEEDSFELEARGPLAEGIEQSAEEQIDSVDRFGPGRLFNGSIIEDDRLIRISDWNILEGLGVQKFGYNEDGEGVIQKSGLNIKWRGAFGIGNYGNGGLTSLSTAKMVIGYGNEDTRSMLQNKNYLEKALTEGSPSSVFGYNIGGGGSVQTIYQYSNSLFQSPSLTSLEARESAGIDMSAKWFKVSPATESDIRVDAAVNTGYAFSQSISSEKLPEWLAGVGYVSGFLGKAERILLTGGALKLRHDRDPAMDYREQIVNNSAFSAASGADYDYTVNSINAFGGTILSFLGPASIAGIKGQNPGGLPGAQFSKSSGIQVAGRLTAGWLYCGLAGVEINLADRYTRYFTGTNKGEFGDTFFANAGLALPLGGMVPLISYLHTWGTASSTSATASSAPTGSEPINSQGFYKSAAPGNGYPMSYAPSTGTNSYFSSILTQPTGSNGQSAFNTSLLVTNSSPLQLLTLNTYAEGLNLPGSTTLPLTLVNAGSNLVDGKYTNVAILGVSAVQNPESVALASFTVAGGSIVADSFSIVSQGTYLGLPETSKDSGIYALILDVFTTGIAQPPAAGTASIGDAINTLPMITVDSTRTGVSPLTSQAIQRIQSVPVPVNSQTPGLIYPIYDPETGTAVAPASNNNFGYSYANVPVSVYSSASAAALTLLNPGVTATVQLSAGVIQRVVLDQPILIAGSTAAANPAPTYTVQLQLPTAVVASLPAGGDTAPTYAVTPESLALNNFVEDEQFSSQMGAANSGVYLAAGLSDQLPLFPIMGGWQVQNRVAYVTGIGTQQPTVTYLNGNTINANGSLNPEGEVSASELSLDSLYSQARKDNNIVFTAASTPTAVTIAGTTPSNGATSYVGDTFVAWVEASQPVIPITSKDGTENYQAFLESLYGSQRINYRLNADGDTGWQAPSLADLYSPENAVIRELKAFNAINPATGKMATLLAWNEVSIDAIKGAAQRIGSGLSIPAVLKVGWLNATPASIQWNDLFSDATGTSTIQEIPWDSATAVGLGISDISLASAPLAQVVNDSSTVSETPVLSWSQDVRTPYRQSVLNDNPYIYLQFGQLKSGSTDINIGSTDSASTATTASSTGLNFSIAGALPSSQATAVQNTNGTGVLTTGMGSLNKMIRNVVNNMAPATYTSATNPNAIGVFTGAINSTILTVSAISKGALRVGDLISGAGIAAGTTITAIDTVDTTGVGTYSVNQSQTVAATTLQTIPKVSGLPTSAFSASISGTTLSVSGLSSGSLAVGDEIFGQGVTPGTTITALGSFNASTGTGSFTINKSQTLASSALVATPGAPTVPYTIEFWAQLQPNSNANGAGLVALGQPSNTAIGAPTMPDGWLLSSSFVVEQITYQQAAARGLIASIPTTVSDPSTTVYAWGWAVVADGTNTTAMAGTGGNNLYSNALQINNLVSGFSLKGIDQFLANYNLSSSDLTGIDGTTAAIAAQVPVTELQFSTAINSTTNQASSSLNAIAVDTDSAILNQGLVLADGSQTISANLESMFKALWAFQQQTGMAKVNLSLAPDSTSVTTAAAGQLPSQYSSESYAGYELGFTLSRGTAISVNGSGQLVFDVGVGSSLTSQAAAAVPADLRDGQWHYIVASYLPSYQAYTVDDTVVQLPTNVGTASLYVDNTLVASNTSVINAYDPTNGNDQALLLATNSGGAIDQLAFYDKALSSSSFSPNLSGDWPTPTAAEALAVMESLGYSIATKSPNPGQIPGAVSSHWQARAVNPNDALLGTYYSVFKPDGQGGGSWSQASNLNPTLAQQATTASASRTGSLQDDLVLSIASTTWGQSGALTVNSTASSYGFNPSRQKLGTITVTLTNKSDSSETKTLTLKPDQILIGTNTLGELQPRATQSNLNYEVLTNTPEFSLVIPKDQLPYASGTNPLADQYSATYTFNFVSATGSTDEGTAYTVTNTTAVTLNTDGAAISTAATKGIAGEDQFKSLEKFQTVIATAAINEQAPTQLKYIDSGEVLTGPQNFGGSQVAGSFTGSNGNRYGWLAIAQPQSFDASSNPAGRVYIQYTGQSLNGTATSDVAQAPSTWLNALAQSTFSADGPNLPLLGNANNPSSSGGLLIEADATTGWDQSFGQVMLVADVNGDGIEDLVIASPQANGGGCVYIIDGTWISNNLTNTDGATTINLANADNLGSYVSTLTPTAVDTTTDNITVAGFGSALAYDSSTSTLLIGAPNYLQQLEPTNTSNPSSSLQPIGAVYSYSYSSSSSSYSQKYSTLLGRGGTTTTPDASNSPVVTYWGSQLGTAIAVDSNGGIALSAPGVAAAMLYSGTQQVSEDSSTGLSFGSKSSSDSDYGDGALLKIQTPSTSNSFSVSITGGTSSSDLVDVANSAKASTYKTEITNYMQNLKELQVDTIASATTYYNQALQANAVGAVYFLSNGSDLASFGSTTTQIIDAESVATRSHGGATFYGVQPWNTLGASGFGKSLAFSDFNNTNSNAVLAIGASQTGGSGAVYLINTTDAFTSTSQGTWLEAINLGNNQYCAYLASAFTLYGAASQDNFGNAVVNLGDVNDDDYQDLLIQAYNANSGAGSGYVLFGNDNLTGTLTTTAKAVDPNPGTSSVAPGSIGLVKRADGSTTITTPILSEIGSGLSTYTGLGTFGSGDVNGDGRNDILLGSGPNGSGYLTWGQTYLESINNLQLNKLTSDTGYMLDGLATTNKNSLRSIGDFNGDGYGDFISIDPGTSLTTVRIELGADTQAILADYLYNYYTFNVNKGTQVLPAGDINGDGFTDIALFLDKDSSSTSLGKGSSAGILYGRASGDLPIGGGFGLLAPVDSTGVPQAALPGLAMASGFTDATPTVISVGTTLYAVVKGYGNTNLYFNQSTDAGNTWNSSWTDLSTLQSGFATNSAPSLEFFNNKLYLAFLNTNTTPTLSLSSWDPTSQNLAAWSTPTELNASSNPGKGFSSSTTPQLINRGDALGVIWVDSSSGTLYGSASAAPDSATIIGSLGTPTAWAGLDGGSSPAAPALARNGNTVYMAVQGNGDNNIWWNYSTDGGATSAASWQYLPGSGMTSSLPPSLAVVNGTLYLSYLSTGNNEIYITSLTDASTNTWSTAYQIPGQSASYATLVTETVAGNEQLAVYYVSNDPTNRILKAYSTAPASSAGWPSDQCAIQLGYNQNTGIQTASSALAVTQLAGQTIIAYLGGTIANPSSYLYLASSSNPNNGGTWNTQSVVKAEAGTGIGLTTGSDGLILGYGSSSQTSDLQLKLLRQDGGAWSVLDSTTVNLDTTGTSNNIAILGVNQSNGSGLLLAQTDSASNDLIETSFLAAVEADSSWSTPSQLLQRVEVDGSANFNPIAATKAPSLTWLGDQAVVAVTNDSTVNVYANIPNTLSWELASTFTAASGDAAISTAPVLASTDTGLALTYGTSDGAINLQRLDLIDANGQLRDTNQSWLKTTLNLANTGLASSLASVPLNVNGTLLLSNVRSNNNAIWLNAIPVNDAPNSSSWKNSSVQQSVANGGAIDPQYSRTSSWQNLEGGLSPYAPAFAELNGVLYAAVQGENNGIWWSTSKDGGQSWQEWQEIIVDSYNVDFAYTTTSPPTLAVYNDTLYLGYVNQQFFLGYFDESSGDWSAAQMPVSGNKYISPQFSTLIAEDDSLSLYYVQDNSNIYNSNIYRATTTTPYSNADWQQSIAIPYSGGTQTASGNLAVARYNNQTTIAYQGGTTTNPSNTIYLTTSSDPGTASSWSIYSSGNHVPQATNPSHSGVGLTANSQGLVLSYADEINDDNVLVLKQGTLTASGWSTASTTNVASPGASAGVNASLFSTSGTSAVLLGAINANASQAITTAITSLTATNYGDLNGDGYLDVLAVGGLDSIDTGDKPSFYKVWSIRAAGDVNGNGLDDILLALTPNNSDNESIQTVLIDGALFKITNNTFSLSDLREPLDPYASSTLNIPTADLMSNTSANNYLPSLQNWIQPIQDYIPSTTIESASLSDATTPIQGYAVSILSTTVAEDGTLFIVNQGEGSNNIYLAYGNPNNANPDWQQVQIPGASTDSMPSLAFFNKTLYIAYKSPVGSTAYSNNGLNIAYNSTPGDYSSWKTYEISGQSSVVGPTLVNEGNHLSLYFVANNSSSEILSLSATDPTNSSSWGGTYINGAFTGSWTAISDSSGGHQTSGASISATRFQGKTILAYLGGTYGSDSSSDFSYWITEKTSEEKGVGVWSAYQISTGVADSNGNVAIRPSIASDATQLYLSTTTVVDSTHNSYIRVGSSYDTWGANTALANTQNSSYGLVTLASTGPGLYGAWVNDATSSDILTISPLSLTTASATQKSLAGYSIDGNVDVNGDGFSDMLISDPSNPSAGIDNQYVLFGGDYLDLASQVGTEANDSLIGTPLADVIFSIGGADVVASQGGADLIYTGSGDDQISIQDNAFRRIDAGSGFDQLLLEGAANQAYDFRLNVPSPQYFIGTKLQDIELISSLGYGANALSFDAAAVNASNPDRILFLACDVNDTITLSNEFVRNIKLDTAFAGQRWYAYAANQQGGLAPIFEANPALIYVSLPADAGANWLDTNITIGALDTAKTAATVSTNATNQTSDPLEEDLFASPNNARRTPFGDGLSVTAYATTTASPFARFAIQRQDTSGSQVVIYSSTDTNALADSGLDNAAVWGLLVFKPGESSKDISVPLFTDSLKTRKDSSLSLSLQELPYNQQHELHLLLQPSIDPSTGRRPVLSGMTLAVDESAATARLSLRADSNTSDDAALKLQLSLRPSADSSTTTETREIAIADFSPTGSRVVGDAAVGNLSLDRDGRANQQVNLQLQVNLTDGFAAPLVSLLGPEVEPASTVKLVNDQQVRFLQDAPLSSWRADHGKGQVTFGLHSATGSLSLITDASGGSAGSLTASNAIDDNDTKGWKSTEGQAIGSRSITTGQKLAGKDWTPTASRNGVSLELLDLVVDGNQITAHFADGVTGVFWQEAAHAPTVLPVPAAVEVQRLAGYANSLGFYSVDSITGNVGTLTPGQSGYLQAALERSRNEGLLLDAAALPAYGKSATFNSLSLDSQKRYGMLLLQNSDPSIIFSSFAAANPGGVTQMVSLSSTGSSTVLGIEDQWTMASKCDADFNDLIVNIKNVALGVF